MSELFKVKETKYDLQTGNQLKSNVPCTTSYGIDCVSYLASKIWSQVPIDIKNCNTLDRFKKMIKTWTPRSWHVDSAKYISLTWVLFKHFNMILFNLYSSIILYFILI